MVIVHGNKIPFYHYNVITYGNFKTSPWAQETAERLWLKDFSAELFLYLVVFFFFFEDFRCFFITLVSFLVPPLSAPLHYISDRRSCQRAAARMHQAGEPK